MKIPEACSVYLPRPSTARLKILPHINDVQRPHNTRNSASSGTSRMMNSPLMKPGMVTRTVDGIRIAASTSTMAISDTAVSCLRVDTFELMAELTRRPTSISSQ